MIGLSALIQIKLLNGGSLTGYPAYFPGEHGRTSVTDCYSDSIKENNINKCRNVATQEDILIYSLRLGQGLINKIQKKEE